MLDVLQAATAGGAKAEYQINDDGAVTQILINGELFFEDYPTWRAMMATALSKPSKHCVLDISGLADMDTSGLGMILVMQDYAGRENKTLSVKHSAKSKVGRLMELARFDRLVTYTPH